MKRKKTIVLFFMLGLFLLCGCKGNQSVNNGEVDMIRVGILIYNQDDMFMNSMMQYLDEGFRGKEKEEDFKITFNFSDAKASQTVQNDQIDKYINQQYDVLCVNMVDRTDAAVIIDKCKKADIPLVFFNREPVSADMDRWEQTYYVGVTASEGGIYQGEIFLEAYGKTPEIDKNGDGIIQYVLLEGEQGHQDTTIRTESCIKTIQEAGVELERLEVKSANWRRSQAKEIMHSWMTEYEGQIEAVFSNNDEMALGVLDVMDELGKEAGSIPIIGLDGIAEAVEAVRAGRMLGTVLNDAKGQAKGVIDLAVSLGKGEKPLEIEHLKLDRSVRVPHKIVK